MNRLPKFLLILNGPPTAGKTSVARELFQLNEGIFLASRDLLKRMISHYRNDDSELVSLSYFLTLDLVEDALTRNFSVVIDQGFFSQNGGEELGETLFKRASLIARTAGVTFLVVNIEASDEVLLERFRSRIENASKEGTFVSLKDEEEFKRRISFYKKYRHHADFTFHSDILSPKEIADEIMDLIRKESIGKKTETI